MGGDWVPCGFILSSQKERGKPIESLGARGRSPRPTPLRVTPSSRYLKCLSRERVVQEGGGVGGFGPG